MLGEWGAGGFVVRKKDDDGNRGEKQEEEVKEGGGEGGRKGVWELGIIGEQWRLNYKTWQKHIILAACGGQLIMVSFLFLAAIILLRQVSFSHSLHLLSV